MKKILLTACKLLVCCVIMAQTIDMRDGSHVFIQPTQIEECDVFGNITGPKKDIEKDWRFYIVRIKPDGNYVIRFLKWNTAYEDDVKEEKFTNRNLIFYEKSDQTPVYFLLTASEYNLSAERWEKSGNFTVGASTTLIKIRPGRDKPKDGYNIYSDISNDFNLGVMAGWKFKPYRRRELSHSLLAGIGFSSIGVNNYNTKGFIQTETDNSAVTVSLGYVMEYNKFQFGFFTGLDMLSGEAGKNFLYKDRPWIGIGFGFAIFRAQGDGEQSKNSDK